MTTATAQSHPNIAFIKYLLAKLGRTNRKVCYKVGNVIDRIILGDEILKILSQLAFVDMFAQTTMDKSTVKSSLAQALPRAKSETNSFHNTGSRRTWMRSPV
jgi:hypothetical protein